MILNEVKPQQMHLWDGVREVLKVHGVPERSKRKPREGTSHTRDDVTQDP